MWCYINNCKTYSVSVTRQRIYFNSFSRIINIHILHTFRMVQVGRKCLNIKTPYLVIISFVPLLVVRRNFKLVTFGEGSQEFGVNNIKTPQSIFYQQKPKCIAQIAVNYHPSVLQLSPSVSGHRWDWVRMDSNLKKVRLTVFKFSRFSFPKCTTAGHELFLSRIQLISFS